MGEKRTDWQGREYTEVRDQSGNITRTYAEKDYKGDTVYRHTDANGRDIGTSRRVRDWTGDTHTEHYDTSGNYTGRSDTYTDYKGDQYAVHRDAQGMETGKSTVGHDWRGSYVHNTATQNPAVDYAPTQSQGGYAPSAPMARRGNGLLGAAVAFGIAAILIFCALGAFLPANMVYAARVLTGLLSLPIVFLAQCLRLKKLGVPDCSRSLRRGNIIAGAVLYFVSELIFLLGMSINPMLDEAKGFLVFALYWVVKFIYAVVSAIRTGVHCKRLKKQSGISFGAADKESVLYMGEGLFLWIFINELILMVGAEFFDGVIAKIIYVPFGAAALFGIVVLLNKLTNLPYSIVTKRW